VYDKRTLRQGARDPHDAESTQAVRKRSRADAGRDAQLAGDSFENSVEAECRGYEMQNIALVSRLRLTARFVGGDIKASKSPPDFKGDIIVRREFYPVLFDCKSFSGDAWDFSEWNPVPKVTKRRTKRPHTKYHQLVALRKMARFQGLAFALVRENRLTQASPTDIFACRAWLVPLAVVEQCIEKGQWSMSVAELDARCDEPVNPTIRIRGCDWYEAAAEMARWR
jgi:hypothetical protein